MAVIIPSRNIYGDIDNNKFAISPVNGVKLGVQKIQPKTTSEAYSTSIYISEQSVVKAENEKKEDFHFKDLMLEAPYETVLAYAYFDNKVEHFTTTVRIPKRVDNKFIKESEIDKIQFKYRGAHFKQIINSKVFVTIEDVRNGYAELGEIENGEIQNDEYGTELKFSDPLIEPERYKVLSVGHGSYDYSHDASAEVYGVPFNEIPVNWWERIETTDNEYVIELTTIGYYYAKVLTGGSGQNNDYYYRNKDQFPVSYEMPVKGYIEILKADVLEITGLEGLGIDVKISQETIGSNSGNIASLNGNELLQNTTITNGEQTIKFIGNKILDEYKDGKETAEILCSIDDYYDTNGEMVISKSNSDYPITFSPNVKCIPFIMNEYGEETFLSKYRNTYGKVFSVVSVEPIYDGSVFQKLTLVETLETYGIKAYISTIPRGRLLSIESEDLSAEITEGKKIKYISVKGIGQSFVSSGKLYIY